MDQRYIEKDSNKEERERKKGIQRGRERETMTKKKLDKHQTWREGCA